MTQELEAAATPEGTPPTAAPPMRKIAIASCLGSVVEFYDLIIFGTAAALVFNQVFFPALGQVAGTGAAFATFGVAFVARPIGAILFGHYGDRLGRKWGLVATMMVMGAGTVLIGLLPTADSIGFLAPTLLVVLRFIQGLAGGGEWAGAVLFVSESSPTGSRGWWAMFPVLGASLAISLASGTFLITAIAMDDQAFVNYGWRIPFLASAVLVAVGLYIRLSVEETMTFTKEKRDGDGTPSIPFLTAFASQPRTILLASGVFLMGFTFNQVGFGYLASYGANTLDLSRPAVLSAGVVGGLMSAVGALLSAPLCDRIGRRPTIVLANCIGVVWAFALWPILDARTPFTFALVSMVTMFLAGFVFGPAGVFLTELFQTRYRYTATGLSYNLCGIVGGAIPPIIAGPIITSHGTTAFAAVMAGLCAVGLLCTVLLPETQSADLMVAGSERSA